MESLCRSLSLLGGDKMSLLVRAELCENDVCLWQEFAVHSSRDPSAEADNCFCARSTPSFGVSTLLCSQKKFPCQKSSLGLQ